MLSIGHRMLYFDLLRPLLFASVAMALALISAATIAPPYSSFHAYLILCGTVPGYLIAVLFLTWLLHVLRLGCSMLQLLRRIVVQGKPGSDGRYWTLAREDTFEEGKSKDKLADETEKGLDLQVVDSPTNECSDDDAGTLTGTFGFRKGMLVGDCVIIGVLYTVMCFLAWWVWAPPTFDVAISHGSRMLTFPPDFKFGAATSAYQVEGNIFNNQWSEFEDDPSGEHISDGQHCGASADMWNRFDSDLEDRVMGLGLQSFRFSVEWARIEPEQGKFDETALNKYASWASKLKDRGVEPIVTLHHFTNPIWFERLGAFENSTSPELILPFVAKVVERLGEYVDRWVTINEIMVYAGNGYLMGEFPPARSGEFGTMLKVVGSMIRTHEAMYRAIKATNPNAKVSIAKNTILYQPWSFLDLFAIVSATVSDLYYNAMPIRILQRQNSIDYLGLNSYIRMKVGPMGTSMGFVFPPERQSDMGWDLEPQVLYQVVKQYHAYLPDRDIIITEHGVADGQSPDMRRVEFLRNSLLGLVLAINQERIPVVGYLHWSLLDNWEWSNGYTPKFGLFRIDLPESQERNLTEGGMLYREIIAERSMHGRAEQQ